MARPLAKWVMYRYSILWNRFLNKEFNHTEACVALKKDKMLSIVLSKLKQEGWLEMKLDEKDARKRIYQLKSPEQAVKEMEKG